VAKLSEDVGLELGRLFDLLLRYPGPSSPGEDAVEIVHLLHDRLGSVATTRRGAIYARISQDRDGTMLGVEHQQADAQRLVKQRG
jgi:hypothetical protein